LIFTAEFFVEFFKGNLGYEPSVDYNLLIVDLENDLGFSNLL